MKLCQLHYCLKAYCYLPITFIKRVVFGRDPYWRQFFWNRWGYVSHAICATIRGGKVFLIIADSYGEVNELFSFADELKKRFPSAVVVVATNTVTGFDLAAKNKNIDHVIDRVWDLTGPAKRLLRALRPLALLIIEQVRVPVLVKVAHRLQVPVIVCSGFFPQGWEYSSAMLRSIEGAFYRHCDAIGAKSDEDAEGFKRIGADISKVHITGDLKCDYDFIKSNAEATTCLRDALGMTPDEEVLIAASIHREEFNFTITAFKEIHQTLPKVRLIMVPRYSQECSVLESLLTAAGYRYVRRSMLLGCDDSKERVIIVDTMGELSALYAVATVAIIGGSLVAFAGAGQGGHNIMEPLIQQCPFVFGPFLQHRRDILDELCELFPGACVKTPSALAQSCRVLLSNQTVRSLFQKKLGVLAEEHRRGISRTVSFIERQLLVQDRYI